MVGCGNVVLAASAGERDGERLFPDFSMNRSLVAA